MGLPLEGIRIVDLSMFMSGPLATLIAADMGADVIKVESLQRLDGWRGAGVGATEAGPTWEQAPSFNWINRNKRDITLNLADPRGAELLKRLIAIADVIVENYTPRVLPNFGLDYEALKAVKPDIIVLSMPGYGLTGPWRDYTSFAWTTEEMSGLSHLTGYEGGPPLFTGTTGGDPLAGLMGAVAMLSALEHRRRTGEGQHIDLSQLETAIAFTGDALMEAAFNGRSPIRCGNWHPRMAPHNIYPCAEDGWLAIACRDDADWARLAAAIGRPELAAAGSPLAALAGRQQALATVDEAVRAWTEKRDARAAMQELQALGIPAGAVLNGPQLLADEHLQARSFFTTEERAVVGLKHNPGQPFRLSRVPARPPRPAPLLGEHNYEVLGGILGLPDDEIRALEDADVTGTVPVAARPD
ncbi:MAG: CoA transferase [Dehalococcoidia bacterium]|nr:CoA transferase [Dehalococcoidia bacterium]